MQCMAPRSSTPHFVRFVDRVIAERLVVIMLVAVHCERGNGAISAGKWRRSIP